MAKHRTIEGAQVACFIIVVIVAVLLIANLAPYDSKSCAWAFPKIFSCLLTLRETLVAGLMAAGGALFAAWLAWTTVTRQLDLESARDEARNKSRETKIKNDIDRLRRVYLEVEALVDAFKETEAPSEFSYLENFRTVSNRGGFVLIYKRLPPPFASKVEALAKGLKNLARSLDPDSKFRRTDASVITDELSSEYTKLDHAVRKIVDDASSLLRELDNGINTRESMISRGGEEIDMSGPSNVSP
jgi:hypothetical protein